MRRRPRLSTLAAVGIRLADSRQIAIAKFGIDAPEFLELAVNVGSDIIPEVAEQNENMVEAVPVNRVLSKRTLLIVAFPRAIGHVCIGAENLRT
jgi:hypothetical protein